MGHFGGQVICDDFNRKIGQAVPGMALPVLARSPLGMRGFRDVTYQLSMGEDPLCTSYSTSTGTTMADTVTIWHNFSQQGQAGHQGPGVDTASFFTFKDPGTYTISIVAVCYSYPNLCEQFEDSITVKVTAPTVSNFVVEGRTPLHVDVRLEDGTTSVGLFTDDTTDTGVQSGFYFHATVSNPTPYRVRMGFLQTVTGSTTVNFADTAADPLTFPNASLDRAYSTINNQLFYWPTEKEGWVDLAPGASAVLERYDPQSMTTSYSYDSPFRFAPGQIMVQVPNQPDAVKLLQSISVDYNFKTFVAMNAGYPQTGIPIGLSQSTWSVKGTAVTSANTYDDVMNKGNWGPAPNTAFTPASAQNYPGVNGISFLSWIANGQDRITAFLKKGGAGLGLASDEHQGLLGHGRDKPAASSLVLSNDNTLDGKLIVSIPETSQGDPVTIQDQHTRKVRRHANVSAIDSLLRGVSR